MRRQKAPDAERGLVFGLLSLALCWVPYVGMFLGVIVGILSTAFASRTLGQVEDEPHRYTGKGLARAGMVAGVAGICASVVLLFVHTLNSFTFPY